MTNIYQYTHPNGNIGEMYAQSIDELKQKIAEINDCNYEVSNIKHIGTFKGYSMGGGLKGNKNNGVNYFKK